MASQLNYYRKSKALGEPQLVGKATPLARLKRTRSTWVTITAGAIVVAALLILLHKGEPLPSYNGKTVAQWFQAFEAGGGHGEWLAGGNGECTRSTVAGLGTDALPSANL